jgi:hypothetical protein
MAEKQYSPITAAKLQKGISLHRIDKVYSETVSLDDPASVVMTDHDQLEVLCMDDVEKAVVGQIVATLNQTGRQHALVADRHPGTITQSLRGIFSAAQIARQLDADVSVPRMAQTFADIERLITKN